MTEEKSPRAPKRVGTYAVEDVLGKGGMGEVYLGDHELLSRKVAIKRLVPIPGYNTGELEERFKREGRALAQLNHHAVVAVHDLFSYRNDLYMVLEYVDGFDVAKLLEAGPLPYDVAAMIALRMAEALEHAHFHRIIHRDIKPSNVMVSKKGEVKLMDFGIAKDETVLDQLTKTGHLVGTPMFLAPEVVTGTPADERADLYALGATLYQMLSGRRLFAHATADNLFALIAAGRYPKLAKVTPGIPRHLRRIVDRCLAKRPDKRYPSAADLRVDLEAFLASQHAWASPAERLVAFLAARGQISESEALTCIDAEDLITSSNVVVRPARRFMRAAVVVAACTAVLIAGVALQQGWVAGLVEKLNHGSAAATDAGAAPTPKAKQR